MNFFWRCDGVDASELSFGASTWISFDLSWWNVSISYFLEILSSNESDGSSGMSKGTYKFFLFFSVKCWEVEFEIL